MAICPYFGQEKGFCAVGEEGISPSDVFTMSHFCSCHYPECDKFQELSDRYPEVLEQDSLSASSVEIDVPVSVKSSSKNTLIKIKFRNKWPLSHRLNCLFS